jgi:hypothetical protein
VGGRPQEGAGAGAPTTPEPEPIKLHAAGDPPPLSATGRDG